MGANLLYAASFWESLDLGKLWSDNGLTQWLVLALGVLVALAVGGTVADGFRRLAGRWEAGGRPGRARVVQGLAGPVRLALLTIGLSVGVVGLRMPGPLAFFAGQTLLLLYSIAVLWFAYNAVDLVGVAIRRVGRATDVAADRQIVLLVSRTLRGLLIVVGALFLAEAVFGWQIGAWLAGLGIAGLAVSLAAQDSLKQVFGSVAILLDRSLRIGDHIVSSGYEGTVEDIGFRSTKLRTTAGSLVTIPNSTLINNPIENLSRQAVLRRSITLTVPAATPAEKVRRLLAAILAIFDEEAIRGPIRPIVDGAASPPQVRFNDVQGADYKLTVAYWYAPAADPDYAAHAERVNLRIAEEMQAVLGIG